MLCISSTLVFMFFASQAGNPAQVQPTPAAQVDKLFERWDKTISPGCAISVMKDGRILYKRGYGMADLDHDVTITPAILNRGRILNFRFSKTAGS